MTGLAVLLLAAATAPQADDGEARTFTDPAGKALPYRLVRPIGFDPAKRYPLVLYLHGAGERGTDNRKHLKHAAPLLDAKAREKFPYFLVAPQCPADAKWTGTNWQADDPKQTTEMSDPLRRVVGLLDAVAKEFPIDPKRVYVTGVSMGGSATWDLITRHPDQFAAAVPVCGGCDAAGGAKLAELPVWAFQGAKDPTVNPRMPRAMIGAIRKAGGEPKYTEYPERAHDIWGEAYRTPELLPWLFEHRRK